MPGKVGASLAELLWLLCKTLTFELDGCFDDGEEVVMDHFIGSITYDFKFGAKEASSFLKSCQTWWLFFGVVESGLRGQRVPGNVE